jgi:hypothetical protein
MDAGRDRRATAHEETRGSGDLELGLYIVRATTIGRAGG